MGRTESGAGCVCAPERESAGRAWVWVGVNLGRKGCNVGSEIGL